jgi:hypothetical protein
MILLLRERNMRALLKELKKEIEKTFGKPCKDHDVICPVCQIWDAYDTIEIYLELEGRVSKG